MSSSNRNNRSSDSGRRSILDEIGRGRGRNRERNSGRGQPGGNDNILAAAGRDDDAQGRRAGPPISQEYGNVNPARGGAQFTARPNEVVPDELVPPATESAERRERESSPSAVSESSSVRLEWDSSADVGSLPLTLSGHERHEGSGVRREYGQEATYPVGVSSLHRIALQLSSGSSGTSNLDSQLQPSTPTTLSTTSGPGDTSAGETRRGIKSIPFVETRSESESEPRTTTVVEITAHPSSSSQALGKSHAQEEKDERANARKLGRGMSKSMIELATGGMRRSDQPILLQPPSITNLKNKNKRDASSRDSVTTILPSKKFDKTEKSEFEDDGDGRAHSTPSSSPVTAVSPAHSPVPSSNPATVSQSISNPSSEPFHRPHRRDVRGRGRRKRDDSDPHRHESSDDVEPSAKLRDDQEDLHLTHNRGVSEASTDWEYGSRSHTPNESSLSDWQHSGLTHSEVKYKKKGAIHQETGDDKSGVYSLTVEVRSDSNMRSDAPKTDGLHHATGLIQQSRGVQTDDAVEKPPLVLKKIHERKSSGSVPARISRSIQTIDQMFELSRGKSAGESTDGIKTDSSFVEQSSSTSGSKISDGHIKQRSTKNKGDPARKNTNVDENNHKQKRHVDKQKHSSGLRAEARHEDKENRHHKDKPKDDDVESILEEFLASEDDLYNLEDDDGSLSSDLSATCLKIQELLKTEPFRGKLLELVYAHHLSHLRSLKADIRRVRQMNKIVVRADQLDIQDENRPSSSASSTGISNLKLAEEYYKELERAVPSKLDMKYTKKHNLYYKVPEARSPPIKPRIEARRKEHAEHEATIATLPQVSSASSGGTYSISNGQRNQVDSPEESSSGSRPALPKHVKRTTVAVGAQTKHPTAVPIKPCESTSKQKLDRLQRTCDMITDLLVLNQGLEPLPQVQDSPLHTQTSDENTEKHYSAPVTSGSKSKKQRDHDRGHTSIVRKTSKSKQSYSFFVSFPNCTPYNYNGFQTHAMPDLPQEEYAGPVKSLQEVFQENHPDILARVKARQEIIQRIKKEREIRGKLKREYIQTHGHRNGEFSSLMHILPPKGPRVMTTREMKDLTNKHYQQLPEVREKKLLARMEREKQTNRLVQQLYAKRVKQEALRGKVNLGLSKSVIRK